MISRAAAKSHAEFRVYLPPKLDFLFRKNVRFPCHLIARCNGVQRPATDFINMHVRDSRVSRDVEQRPPKRRFAEIT